MQAKTSDSCAPPSHGLRFEVFEGLPTGWDDLVGESGGSFRRRWVELAEQRIPSPLRTFAVRREGELRVALIGGVMPTATNHVRFDPYRVLSGGSASAGVASDGPHPWAKVQQDDAFPSLLLMFPGYETAPVGPGARSAEELHYLLDEIADWARDHGARSIGVLFVRSDYSEFVHTLQESGYDVVPMVERGDLEVRWTDFDGYLSSLPRKRRFSVRREIREIEEQGIRIRESSLPDDASDLIRLRNQLVRKYGGEPDEAREIETMRLLREKFLEHELTVVEARQGDALVSFALLVREGATWTVLMTGTDYDHPQASFTYFSVMFYRPARVAPEQGIERIISGLGTLQAKRLRGCTMTPLLAAGRIITAD